jgi:hypothetical protein
MENRFSSRISTLDPQGKDSSKSGYIRVGNETDGMQAPKVSKTARVQAVLSKREKGRMNESKEKVKT